mgnify:CR=1 FL=1
MFRKKIDRELQGVIVVGQNETADIAQELDEYVVTNELQRHFADFLQLIKKVLKANFRNGCLDFRLLWQW